MASLHPAFQQTQYLFRRKVMKLLGGAFHIYDTNNNVLFFAEQKAFKLKEDLRIYSDEKKTTELISIKAQSAIDFSATYVVQDSTTGEVVGSLRRKGLKSLFKDEWQIMDGNSQVVGKLAEASALWATLSRIINLIPQKYVVLDNNGTEVARIEQSIDPIVLKYNFYIPEPQPAVDRRLLIASGILLAAVEGRQEG